MAELKLTTLGTWLMSEVISMHACTHAEMAELKLTTLGTMLHERIATRSETALSHSAALAHAAIALLNEITSGCTPA
jgi:hypothetical protein